jgi:formylglycine-generating enzyme required for sulfatase activity
VYREKTTYVKQFKANPWGFHDMGGNLRQWCDDWYGAYLIDDVLDPKGPQIGTTRVLRGGSWYCSAKRCRAAYRYTYAPGCRSDLNGFRICLHLPSH